MTLPDGHPVDLYWFCESGHEASWKEIGENVGRVLHEQGHLKTAEAKPVSLEEAKAAGISESQWGYGASNSRSRADRLRELGWKPKGLSVFDVMPDEAKLVLK